MERHPHGNVCYPLGLKHGVAIVGEGDTYQEALSDAVAAVEFTLETIRDDDAFEADSHAEEVFLAEAEVRISAEVPRRRA